MEIAKKKRENNIFPSGLRNTDKCIYHCDKESSFASIVPIVFTVVAVEATAGLPLFGFYELLMPMENGVRASVCSLYTPFIVAYVCVGVFFNK